jgi:hypothetical protein
MSTKIRLGFVYLASVVLAFFGASIAFAASSSAPDDAALLDLLRPIVEAVGKGEFALAGAFGVIFAVAATKRYLPDRFGGKFARSDLGGMLSAFLYAGAGSVATTIVAGAPFSGSVALAAVKFGMGAIGGFVALHKLATALVATKWWNEKAPGWLRATVSTILAIIGSNAASKAKTAGEKAVADKPAAGMGSFTDVQ